METERATIYNVLFNYTPKWNIFLLIKASLKNDPWLKDLRMMMSKDINGQEKMNNIKFIHYDSPFADRDFLEIVKKADSSKENMFMFDETHNFIRNVYSNISSKKGKRAHMGPKSNARRTNTQQKPRKLNH